MFKGVLKSSEERFILAKGLNDILIALGIGVLLIGIGVQILIPLFEQFEPKKGDFLSNLFQSSMIYSLIGLAICWGFSEYLTAYRKSLLSSMVLVLGLTIFSYSVISLILLAFPQEAFFNFMDIHSEWSIEKPLPLVPDWKVITILAAPIGVLWAYYWRFQFPFSLFMIGLTSTIALLIISLLLFPKWSPMKAPEQVCLLAGCLIFLWALAFDLKDPTRKTRFTDCAFWLHLLAAPLIVKSLIWILVPNLSLLSSSQAVILFLITFILGIVSLIIDRRALFIAGLFYLGISIAYGAKMLMGHDEIHGIEFSFTTISLGGFVILLGTTWGSARRILIKNCVPKSVSARLRPVEGDA